MPRQEPVGPAAARALQPALRPESEEELGPQEQGPAAVWPLRAAVSVALGLEAGEEEVAEQQPEPGPRPAVVELERPEEPAEPVQALAQAVGWEPPRSASRTSRHRWPVRSGGP